MIAGYRRGLVGALFAAMASAVVQQAYGSGFYVPQKGAGGVGLASAGGAARASDASTVFFNPAGMTLLGERRLEAGIDLLSPDVKIENRGSTATTPGTGGVATPYSGGNGDAGSLTAVPHVYFAAPWSPDLWIGFAATSPFGLSLDYARDWFGRYDSIQSKLVTLDFAPSLAWRVSPTLSIGGGINLQYADAKLTNAVPDTLNPGGPTPATDGLAKLTGDGWASGFNVGILYHPSERTRVGMHYRSGMRHKLDGDATIEDLGGPLAAANGIFKSRTEFRLPWVLSLALSQELTPSWRVLGEYQRFGWSEFDQVRIRPEGLPETQRPQHFRDSSSLALGVEYQSSERWTWRAGVRVENTPTVDQFRNTSIPDSDLRWFGVGVSYRASSQLGFDFGVLQARFKRADINLSTTFFEGTPVAGTVNVRGETENVVNTFSVTGRYSF